MASARATDEGDTAGRILDSAEALVQVRGFNGFSYADVAGELSLTTASLHYHFPGKAELGRALIARYAERFNAALEAIDAAWRRRPTSSVAYADLYADVLRESAHVPLRHARGGVPDAARAHARRGDRLLRRERAPGSRRVLAQGRDDGYARRSPAAPREAARLIVSALEGAMLVARPYGDVERFETAADGLLAGFRRPRRRRSSPRSAATTARTTASSPTRCTPRSAARSSATTSARTTG